MKKKEEFQPCTAPEHGVWLAEVSGTGDLWRMKVVWNMERVKAKGCAAREGCIDISNTFHFTPLPMWDTPKIKMLSLKLSKTCVLPS